MNGLPGLIQRGLCWAVGKDAPARDVSNIDVAAEPFVDQFKTQRSPTKADLVKTFKETVHACATMNAQTFAAVPLRLYVTTSQGQAEPRVSTRALTRREERHLEKNAGLRRYWRKAVEVREVLEHPALALLEIVNENIDGFTLLELTDLYQEVVGNAYWYIQMEKVFGIPIAIWILEAQFVTIMRKKSNVITGYEYGTGMKREKIKPEFMVPFAFPNLRDPNGYGWSPARAAWESINIVDKSNAYIQAVMDNRGRPDIVMQPKEPIGEEEAIRFEKRYQKKFRQGGAGGVLILEEDMTVSPLNFTAKDVEMLSYHGASKVGIANNFGVPMSKLETKNVNRANAEAGDYQHARNAILPRCRRHEQRLNQRYAPMFDDRLFFAFDNPVPEDTKTLIQMWRTDAGTGDTTINERRADRGLDPVEWGDKPWVKAGMVQLGEEQSDDGKVRPKPGNNESEEDEDKRTDKERQREEDEKAYPTLVAYCLGEVTREVAIFGLTRDVGVTYGKALAWTESLGHAEPKLSHHERDHDITVDGWDKHESKRAGHQRHLPEGKGLAKALRAEFRLQHKEVMRKLKVVDKAPDLTTPIDLTEKWTPRMAKKLRPFIQIEVDKGGKDALARLGVSSDDAVWNVHLPEVRDAVDDLTLKFSATTNRTTTLELNSALAKLREQIAEGLISPDNTLAEMTKRVSSIFTSAEKWRAKQIASTESSRALHMGQLISAKQSGVVRGFKWLLSGDACPICVDIAAANPQGIELEGTFKEGNGGEYSSVPHPPAHPNCMCTLTEILGDVSGTDKDD